MLHRRWLLCISQNPEYGRFFFFFFLPAAALLNPVFLCALKSRTEPGMTFVLLRFSQYKQNPEMFKQTARLWSHVYAGAPVSSPEYTRKIDKLCAMGFEKVCTLLFFQNAMAVMSFFLMAFCLLFPRMQ